ncbi:hypothetical protein [Streptomyces nodosus]|uniref:Uncharacterized protein n=1 Tax=Streptomyces nodosus TaxID=40318 RepID=A0A0B5DFH8_9ACTN|nr:hypothetical protein [Streptomyces nodosus]AJE38757.1 hypothetical protein SNOD_00605 [Streptomyces nodosus]MBB4789493.1 hypothetical protein [Streptomyces nodosus]
MSGCWRPTALERKIVDDVLKVTMVPAVGEPPYDDEPLWCPLTCVTRWAAAFRLAALAGRWDLPRDAGPPAGYENVDLEKLMGGLYPFPVAGTLIQSLNDNDYGLWSTVLPGQIPDSDGPQTGQFFGGEPYAFRFSTPSGSAVTDVRVGDGLVERSVRAVSSATETMPLILKESDRVVFSNGTIVPLGGSASATATGVDLHRGPGVVHIRWGEPHPATIAAASIKYLGGTRRMHILKVPHAGTIDVTVRLAY